MTEKIAHTKGPVTVRNEPYEDGKPYIFIDAGPQHPGLGGCYNPETGHGFHLSTIMCEADASLIARFNEVPHHCADPNCPGDINRRKLEVFEALREAGKKAVPHLTNVALRYALAIVNNLPSQPGGDLPGSSDGAIPITETMTKEENEIAELGAVLWSAGVEVDVARLAAPQLHAKGLRLTPQSPIATALRAEREAWQPIEMAPRDGSDFLALLWGKSCAIVCFDDESDPEFPWVTLDGPNYQKDAPTHWMPLPKTPDAALAKTGGAKS